MKNNKEQIKLTAAEYGALIQCARKIGWRVEQVIKNTFTFEQPGPILCKDLSLDIISNSRADCFIQALKIATNKSAKTIWEWFDKNKLYENPNQEITLYLGYDRKLTLNYRSDLVYNFKYINSRMAQILKTYGYLKCHTSKFKCNLDDLRKEQTVIVLCKGCQGEESHYVTVDCLRKLYSSFDIQSQNNSFTFYIKKA